MSGLLLLLLIAPQPSAQFRDTRMFMLQVGKRVDGQRHLSVSLRDFIPILRSHLVEGRNRHWHATL